MKANFKSKSFDILNGFVLMSFAILCFYPLYYIFINSISSPNEVMKGVYLLPRKLTLANYREVFKIPLIFSGVFVSTARTVVGTIITVLCTSFVSYMVTIKDLPFRKLIYRMIIITMYFNAGLIPWYMVMKSLHLKNNFLLYILPFAVTGFYLILVKTYIESLPQALEESASIDGAGLFTIFFRIILPVSIPLIACISVFSAVGQWNYWIDNMFLVTDKNLQTLQYTLYKQLQNNMSDAMRGASASSVASYKMTPRTLRLTMTFVTVFPILVVYPALQKYFVKGIMLGAIKG